MEEEEEDLGPGAGPAPAGAARLCGGSMLFSPTLAKGDGADMEPTLEECVFLQRAGFSWRLRAPAPSSCF